MERSGRLCSVSEVKQAGALMVVRIIRRVARLVRMILRMVMMVVRMAI